MYTRLASVKTALVASGIDNKLVTTQGLKLKGIGEGNTCYALVTHRVGKSDNHIECHQEMFTLLGEKRSSAENVGNRLAGLVKRYLLQTDALVDEYLTDQLLLPLALSGGGEFTARVVSEHAKTQAWLIEQFLPVEISFETIFEDKILGRVLI